MTNSSHPDDQSLVAGNVFNKYETKNPVFRLLMGNFLKSFDQIYLKNSYTKLLEVGCGEGYLLSHINAISRGKVPLSGIDNSEEIIEIAKTIIPQANLSTASATELPFEDQSFDVVVACEVLEHIAEYQKSLSEIERVGRQFFIFSVPREPVWRLLNFCRFKYWPDFGNTPGHVNHWSAKEFTDLISEHFIIEKALKPFPWTMILARKKPSS